MNLLITGGASGLGLAITKLLVADSNNKLYITYCSSIQSAQALEAEYANVESIKCDFNVPKEMESLLDRLKEIQADVLINNAYGGDTDPVHYHKIPSEEFANDFTQNVLPVIQLTQEAIRLFRKKRKGKIITILTAYLAGVPPIGLSKYVAGKAYLEKMTKVWAAENARFGISSNSVSPSIMHTKLSAATDERVLEQMIEMHPLKELVPVDEVAKTVHFLVGASAHINGVDILMNAGANLKS